MSTGERETDSPATAEAEPETPAAEPKVKLALDVQIDDVGPCKKHVKVAIPRSDVERQFKESVGEMTKEAQVPGFRPGHAPRGLVEKRFRKEVANQVKSALLMASLEQLDEDYKLNPISQPNLDVAAIELPDDGPMKYEIEVEVRPDFPLPAYKSLTVKRPSKTITEADVDAALKTFLERYAQLVPKLEGGAEVGDFITADLKFHKDGAELNEAKEIQIRLQPELRFQDGHIPDLESVLKGAKPGETKEATAQIGSSSPDPRLRGQSIGVTIVVHDLKTLRMPEVDDAFLRGIGFDNPQDLREGLRGVLERRLEFQKREALKREIVDQLLDKTPIDLPADLVSRQEQTTLRRRYHELKESGLDDSAIRAREAQIRANVHESTLQSLKEFFLLAKIAEEEGIKVEEEDLENEIMALAIRTDESPRRIRARVQKEGLDDVLASQILERKTIDRIGEYVKFEDIALEEEGAVETIDETVGVASEEEPASAEGGSSEA
ncbi:MAG TPA: trigger factor [Isosphaeraceae bacterium]